MVPEGWEVKHLSELAIKISDGIHKTPLYADKSDIHFINGNNLKNGSIIIQDSTKFVDENDARNHRKDLGKRTLLMSINGTIGNLAYYRGENVVLGKSAAYINVKGNVDLDFVYYVLSSSKTKNFYESELTGTTIRNLSIKSIKNTRVYTPPLPEQRKIAAILSTWDKAITTTEQLLVNSQQQKKALMQQLLTGKKRLLDENGERFRGEWKVSKTPYKQLPVDWSEIGLSEISSFITKGSTPTTYGYEWQDSGIPFIRSECVGENGFKESGLAYIGDDAHQTMSRSKVFSGDILITITGNVGRVSKLPNSITEANINQHIAKVTLDKNAVYPDFVFHCLQDRKYRVHFERITTGQAYPQISLVQVRDVVIPMPTMYEQKKIASVLTVADEEISALQQKVEILKQEKKALMQHLLTGKRRVKIDEVAT